MVVRPEAALQPLDRWGDPCEMGPELPRPPRPRIRRAAGPSRAPRSNLRIRLNPLDRWRDLPHWSDDDLRSGGERGNLMLDGGEYAAAVGSLGDVRGVLRARVPGGGRTRLRAIG